MRRLDVHEDHTSYAGLFSGPAFKFWSLGMIMLERVYLLFNEYGVGVNDIKIDATSPDSSPTLNIDLGDLGDYKFGLEQVEWEMSNLDDDDLVRVPEVLSRGVSWLCSTNPGLTLKEHNFNYFSHNKLSGLTSQEFLREFHNVDISGVGKSLGSGLIYHWELPEKSWRMSLTIDHSNVVEDGLFIYQDILVSGEQIDYTELVISSRKLLKETLAKIGLEFEDKG